MTAEDLTELGVIDDIIPEPAGGAHSDWEATGARLKAALQRHLAELRALDVETLRMRRLEKFMGMGQWRTGR